MALMPQRMSDSGACSREEPQPKLMPGDQDRGARRTTFWLNGCSGSCLRASSNACSPRPSNVTALRKRAGMMRSVSMSLPGTGMPRPAISVRARGPRSSHDLPHVGDGARDARPRRPWPGSSGACGRWAALPTDEVAVAGGRAHLAALELVVVHAEAHRAARASATRSRPPGRPRAAPRASAASATDCEPGHDERAHAAWPPCPSARPSAATRRSDRRRVRAGADERRRRSWCPRSAGPPRIPCGPAPRDTSARSGLRRRLRARECARRRRPTGPG